jgi:GNAT superfamily N-acetyltransferase
VSSGEVRVRAASLADLDVVVALRLALLREHATNPVYGRIRGDAPARARRLFGAQLASTGEVTLLAERQGVVIGIARCIESASSPLLDPPRYGYMGSVYVVPAARRAGVMRTLVAAGEAWCAERGLGELRLHSVADHAGSNAAWDALGFAVVEHLRVRKIGDG